MSNVYRYHRGNAGRKWVPARFPRGVGNAAIREKKIETHLEFAWLHLSKGRRLKPVTLKLRDGQL